MYQGDSAPNPILTCVREDGSVIDLTDTTVRFIITNPQTKRHTNDPNADTGVTNVCTLVNAAEGQCTYAWNPKDLPVAGIYPCMLVITYTDNKQETREILVSATARS